MKLQDLCLLHDPEAVSQRAGRAARALGWKRKLLHRIGKDGVECFLSGSNERTRPNVLLSAGIHGDEPAGVEAVLQWMETPPQWVESFCFTVLPCLNPWGLRNNSRYNEEGIDLNRSFLRDDVPLVETLRQVYQARGPFDLALLLHEDYDACGIYLYETPATVSSWGHRLIQNAQIHCPIDSRTRIEGRPHDTGVLRRPLRWKRFLKIGMPEAVYLYRAGCPRIYTMETPSEWDIRCRVKAHLAFVETALSLLEEERKKKSPQASAA
ncbi:M14 family metallopeptidase [Candidatus Methylacidithermus pantelleriae]|uniref:Succinylglutamate desuccinylase/aspartoacylase family protein n=1 Tax=Candidatus Methylacidithermus pantelleriae TaxID=2744239 RepID=A0A8J2FVJ7_9BACT|nr:M14 family metallocarboxypeptidase [Candidatus Methylacidithermus pantelleriae]CAF0693913.1 Succinylglutamate desuccinylase/aspartoacylase family protein [Candidatus Methylacidithermus pantelleriae]